ncbi:NADPH:quinone reductase [Sansalvadorimonas sp. 2012CJ34-2]|uniref:NADPH:quinone reductase n=1 Tax=Parendozoicomonas callyspongiae TaxID=2942213 RepID=A0ABT0PH50_9GAMM|nr:NADPH:quinone reductase [Sansalvadorimonas sp. 2012CJ34-2]MCL6270707.1 NADPH:quinone reductase [Sansalvadorimonas sp. 2012CJ34-2]
MTMKAIRQQQHGDIDQLKLETVQIPQPGPGQILVKIHAAGVNPVDTYIRAGTNGYTASMPHTPGKDGAGTIAAMGDDKHHFLQVGDRVYIAGSLTGTSAEYALCESRQVFPLPANVSYEAGACIGVPCATAWRALFQRGNAKPGETLLVHGASGGVGLAAVQLGIAAGMTVIGTAGTEEGRQLVKDQGAHLVLDHHSDTHLEDLLEWTHGQGVNLTLEMLANVNLGHDLSALAHGGRVVVIGSRGTVTINPREIMKRDAAILGMALANASEQEMNAIHAALYPSLASGSLKPVIAQEFTLDNLGEAHNAVLEPGARGNIVIKVC